MRSNISSLVTSGYFFCSRNASMGDDGDVSETSPVNCCGGNCFGLPHTARCHCRKISVGLRRARTSFILRNTARRSSRARHPDCGPLRRGAVRTRCIRLFTLRNDRTLHSVPLVPRIPWPGSLSVPAQTDPAPSLLAPYPHRLHPVLLHHKNRPWTEHAGRRRAPSSRALVLTVSLTSVSLRSIQTRPAGTTLSSLTASPSALVGRSRRATSSPSSTSRVSPLPVFGASDH